MKQWGTPEALTQLRGYMRDYRKEYTGDNIRGILVALDFSRRCIEEYEELRSVEFKIKIVRAKKTFNFNEIST